jgi:hypothetical protein
VPGRPPSSGAWHASKQRRPCPVAHYGASASQRQQHAPAQQGSWPYWPRGRRFSAAPASHPEGVQYGLLHGAVHAPHVPLVGVQQVARRPAGACAAVPGQLEHAPGRCTAAQLLRQEEAALCGGRGQACARDLVCHGPLKLPVPGSSAGCLSLAPAGISSPRRGHGGAAPLRTKYAATRLHAAAPAHLPGLGEHDAVHRCLRVVAAQERQQGTRLGVRPLAQLCRGEAARHHLVAVQARHLRQGASKASATALGDEKYRERIWWPGGVGKLLGGWTAGEPQAAAPAAAAARPACTAGPGRGAAARRDRRSAQEKGTRQVVSRQWQRPCPALSQLREVCPAGGGRRWPAECPRG